VNSLLKKIFQNHSTRVLALLFFALLVLIGYFLGHSYYVQLDIHKNKVLSTLNAVSKTAAAQLDANQLDYLLDKYKEKDEIKSNDQDGVYEMLHEQLIRIQELNNLNTSIYTLRFDETQGCFFFGVNSTDKPFYLHRYSEFPEELKINYNEGGVLDVYSDENGHWISAFSPIKNEQNKTISIVQVDARFDDFLEEARIEIFKNIGISLAFTFVVLFFLIRSIRSILFKEDQLTASLIQSKLELEQKGQETLDSILYAKKIQDAILPVKSIIKSHLPDSFIFYAPRDIVSGDFYWFKKTRNKLFIASVDCTGHGVPGAFMSMIGSILLDDIINKKQVDQPNEILKLLHEGIVKALKQAKKSKASRDGMDVALCVIDEDFNKLSFAGAFRPLIFIRNGELTRIKSTSAPIGGIRDKRVEYELHEINVSRGDSFYIFSDGFPDQFSGETNKKYMTKRFREFLLKISSQPMSSQEALLLEEFNDWKGEAEQVDDVLVIGFKL
jgi:serine phosphatase RsbU (regulator of sigma subunit)